MTKPSNCIFIPGEICLRGDPVAHSYYKNPEKTSESFFMEDGKRWFRTGDIGEMAKDGERKFEFINFVNWNHISDFFFTQNGRTFIIILYNNLIFASGSYPE